ncbi:hypothetical protein INR49_005909 [Caranx melampygus]|nr:hypothetical protein INR49_005909 [Caranx melampygus]
MNIWSDLSNTEGTGGADGCRSNKVSRQRCCVRRRYRKKKKKKKKKKKEAEEEKAAARRRSRSSHVSGSLSLLHVCVLYFAKSVELTGVKQEESVTVPTPISSRDLWSLLLQRHPRLSILQDQVVLAVRQEYVAIGDQVVTLGDGDEVAVVPPLKMTEEQRDVFKLSRDWLSVQEVVDAVNSSSCGAVWVKVGEASVVMAISSPHRHDGQQAIQHCIEQLKANVPVWKKEVYDSQEASWKENAECSWSSHRTKKTELLDQ